MTTATAYAGKAIAHAWSAFNKRRLKTLETDVKTFAPLTTPTVIQELVFQFQSTQFTKTNGAGNARIYSNSAPSTINEETEATVAAYATFDDVGGLEGSAASTSIFDATMRRVPLQDNEGRTAYYHGHWKHIAWSPYFHPTVEHQNQFMRSNSAKLNVPGTTSIDQEGFIYYDSHANFNVSASLSMSLWFYPTTLDPIASEPYRYLIYRYIDASNYFIVNINTASGTGDNKVRAFVNETATLTKIASTNAVTPNTWNLIIVTYNPSTNALVLYLNATSSTTSTSFVLTPPYTTDAHMYLGGLPNLPDKRFTGYLDNFVFWTGKILTGTEAGNMWSRGTII